MNTIVYKFVHKEIHLQLYVMPIYQKSMGVFTLDRFIVKSVNKDLI